MHADLRAVADNVRRADTETLLDRATVYWDAMEPFALDLIEGELSRRGVSAADLHAHAARRGERALTAADGTVRRCSLCDRPAVMRQWAWHRLGGRVPVFPRPFSYCEDHAPVTEDGRSPS